MKKLIIILLLLMLTTVSGYSAEETDMNHGSRTFFELNSDMVMFSDPTFRMLMGWQRNLNSSLQIAFDAGSSSLNLKDSDRKMGRTGFLLLFSGVSLALNRGFSLTAHDLAHIESARAIGGTNVSLRESENGPEVSTGEFLLKSFGFGAEPAAYYYTKYNVTPENAAYVSGQGLNINLLTAAETSRKINTGIGQISDLPPYLLNKTWGIPYFLSKGELQDGTQYINHLQEQGYDKINSKNIIYLNTASLLLSGGSISLIKGAYDFINEGKTDVDPIGINAGEINFCWPEITTWLNRDNVSLSGSFDIRWRNSIYFFFCTDTPVLGNTRRNSDLTIGSKVKIGRWFPGAEMTSHRRSFPFVKGGAEYSFTDTFSAGADGFYGRKNTMRELREYPSGPGAVLFLKVRI